MSTFQMSNFISTVLEITVGHWTLSDQNVVNVQIILNMFGHNVQTLN